MASIPIVAARSVLPSDQALPMFRPQERGDPLGSAIGEAGRRIQRISAAFKAEMDKLQAEDNKREFSKLDTEMADFIRTVTYGDGTEENTGYLNSMGEHAINGYKVADSAIAAKRKELEESASNQEVKDMFSLAANERIGSAQDRFRDHAADERVKANAAVSDARINNAALDAAAAWSEPEVLEDNLDLSEAELTSRAALEGWSPDFLAMKLRDVRSKVVSGVAETAMTYNVNVANNVISQYSQDISPFTRADLYEKMEQKRRQNIADAERFERQAEKALNDRHKEVERQAFIRAARGDLTLDDAVGLLQNNDISVSQYENILGYMNSTNAGTPDNLSARNRHEMELYQNHRRDFSDFYNDPDLSERDKSYLIGKLIEFDRSGGTLNTLEMHEARERIEVIVGGGRDPETKKWLDIQAGERALRAIDELHERVKAGENPTAVLDDIINTPRWRGTVRNLNTYPQPYKWEGAWPPLSKEIAIQNWKEAFRKLQADRKANKIDQEGANRELKNLMDIQRMINIMMDTSDMTTSRENE